MDDIESGNVKHTADAAIMNEILKEMNAQDTLQQPPQYQPQPPQYQQQPMPQPMPMPMPMQMYQPELPSYPNIPSRPQQHYEEEVEVESPKKRNKWGTMFEMLRDPLLVAVIVCVVSLPALHTRLSRHMKWAYAVGGSLSWIGLALQSIIAAGLFALFRECIRDLSLS